MIINTNQQLREAVAHIEQKKQIAIDTEFYWMRTYYPQLCLIQIATEDQVFLIDTMEKLDYSLLKSIFENSNIQKIIHSAVNDIPIIRKFLDGCEVNNIFDTQLAATFLGFQNQLSLKSLIKDILDIDIQKESQFSDWRKRPLSEKQINYAIQDVINLIDLKKALDDRLSKSNCKSFFEQELIEISSTQFDSADNIFNKIGNIQKFPEQIQRNIILLANWREKTAQTKNIPIKFIFDNDVLYSIAYLKPAKVADFNTDKFKRINYGFRKAIVAVLSSDQNVDKYITSKKNPVKLDNELVNKVVTFFDQKTSSYNIDKTFIASRKNIRSLIYNLKLENKDLNNRLLKSWRYTIIGKDLKNYITDLLKTESCRESISLTP